MQFLDTTLDELYLSCSDSIAIPSSPSHLEWRFDFPGATREAPWVPRRNSRIPLQLEKTHEVPCHRQMMPLSAAASQEKSHTPS